MAVDNKGQAVELTKAVGYPPRYVEDFLDISNKVAVKLSKCAVEGLFTTLLVSMKK